MRSTQKWIQKLRSTNNIENSEKEWTMDTRKRNINIWFVVLAVHPVAMNGAVESTVD